MKSRLDDFFKNKLDNHETPLNEAAWESMLGELDARDSKKKRTLLFWFTGIAGLLLFATLGFYFINKEKLMLTAEQSKVEIESSEKTFPPKKLHKNRVEKTGKVENLSNDLATITKEEISAIPLEKAKGRLINSNNSFDENEIDNIKYDGYTPLSNNFLESKSEATASSLIEESVQVIPKELIEISLLEIETYDAEFSEGTFSPKIIPIRKMKNFSMEFGFIGKGIADNQSKSVTGWGAGLYADYYVNSRFSLGSGVNYNQLSGDFENTKNTSQIIYGFGRTTSTQRLTPESLSILEIPLDLGYSFKRNKFTAGISANYLLTVLGEKESIETIAALPQPTFRSGRIVQKDAPEIPKFNWAAQVAYERDFRYLNIGLRGKYYLNNYFQIADQPKSNLMTAEAFVKFKICK